MLKRSGLAMLVYLALTVVAFWGFLKWPTSYLPQEDMGHFMTSIQLPPGASLERTRKVVDAMEKEILREVPQIEYIVSMAGQSFFNGSGTNAGSFIVQLKPWSERKGKEGNINNIIDKVNRITSKYQEAVSFSVNPPAIPGLGMSSGLEMQLLDISNRGTDQMEQALRKVESAARRDPRIASVNTTFQGGTPQYRLKFDRDHAELMGVSLSSIYNTLSSYMGQSYVDDFDEFGRSFQVIMKSQGEARGNVDDVLKLSVMNSEGKMVPFSSFTTVEPVMGLATVNRYNMYTTAGITATPASGVSSSEGIKAMEEIVDNALGKNYGYAWTGEAYQETQAGTTVSIVFIFAVIMTLLVLAAQYESWSDPIAVILSMPVAVLGTVLGCICMDQSISIYTQIGLILLLGMSAKNAILIVEFARDYHKQGVSVIQAAQEAGQVRFRPIMMTALAFVFGVLPMLFATGPGANSRVALGTAIVFGMAMNAFIGTLFVPTFWAFMQNLSDKIRNKYAKKQA